MGRWGRRRASRVTIPAVAAGTLSAGAWDTSGHECPPDRCSWACGPRPAAPRAPRASASPSAPSRGPHPAEGGTSGSGCRAWVGDGGGWAACLGEVGVGRGAFGVGRQHPRVRGTQVSSMRRPACQEAATLARTTGTLCAGAAAHAPPCWCWSRHTEAHTHAHTRTCTCSRWRATPVGHHPAAEHVLKLGLVGGNVAQGLRAVPGCAGAGHCAARADGRQQGMHPDMDCRPPSGATFSLQFGRLHTSSANTGKQVAPCLAGSGRRPEARMRGRLADTVWPSRPAPPGA